MKLFNTALFYQKDSRNSIKSLLIFLCSVNRLLPCSF